VALKSTISLTAKGDYNPSTGNRVWAGASSPNGVPVASPAPGSNCNNWTDSTGVYKNAFGSAYYTDVRWWSYNGGFNCDASFGASHVYCLED
jgi:hypothetical protein